MTGLRLVQFGQPMYHYSIPGRSKIFLKPSDRLCAPPRLLFIGYLGIFHGVQSGRDVMLSHVLNRDVKNGWSYFFTCVRSLRDNFKFTFLQCKNKLLYDNMLVGYLFIYLASSLELSPNVVFTSSYEYRNCHFPIISNDKMAAV